LPIAAAVLVIIAGLHLIGHELSGVLASSAARIEELGAWAPVVFVAGFAVGTLLLVPGALLALAAGALFGVVWGALYSFLGAVLGSAGAFLIARYVARSWLERRIAGSRRLAAVQRVVARDGFRIVLLLRLSPLIPFDALNYALGLTRVRFRDFLLASVGMLPAILLYVYSGRVLGDVARLAGGAPVEQGAWFYVVLGLGFVATAAVTVLITRRARRGLQEGDRSWGDLQG
jgi:uncharacterized membrane protein YdjX (TVP38/TMEM64 family)